MPVSSSTGDGKRVDDHAGRWHQRCSGIRPNDAAAGAAVLLPPAIGALLEEIIDVAAILKPFRALRVGRDDLMS